MSFSLHGHPCTILVFVEPGGELESVILVVGTLDCTGDVPMLLPAEGGQPVRIPEHLMDLIERSRTSTASAWRTSIRRIASARFTTAG